MIESHLYLWQLLGDESVERDEHREHSGRQAGVEESSFCIGSRELVATDLGA